jgi:hypothetical protein
MLDPVFKGGGAASPTGNQIGLFWHQSGAIFEWSGSKFCELSYWILLLEQSAQISYMMRQMTFNFFHLKTFETCEIYWQYNIIKEILSFSNFCRF